MTVARISGTKPRLLDIRQIKPHLNELELYRFIFFFLLPAMPNLLFMPEALVLQGIKFRKKIHTKLRALSIR